MHRAVEYVDNSAYDIQRVPDVQSIETEMRKLMTVPDGHSIDLTMCSYCKTPLKTSIVCPKCDAYSYCNLECRHKHWMKHKFHCRLGRPIDEADHLVQYCHREQYPSGDEDVATTFGFRCFISAGERLRLFELYRKLITIGCVSDEELREAWKSNQLRAFILFRGSQLPPQVIKDDLTWFRSQDCFAAGRVRDFGLILDSAQHVLGSGGFNELNTRQKQQAYLFYCQIRHGYIPDADEDNWLNLGFCTAQARNHRSQIGGAYAKLITRCTFEEFWQAIQKSTIVELFDRHGLTSRIEELRNFTILMQSVGKWHQSVWELKRFIQLPNAEPMRAVVADYGFMNCQNAQDRVDLRALYSRFFDMGFDEIRLHQACVEGRLASHMESVMGKLLLTRELLSNMYPLDRCSHAGLVAEKPVICTESNYSLTCELLQAEGTNSVVWTIPDECDEDMKETMPERAAYLMGSMGIQRTTFKGQNIEMISSG